jgi:hypothetical protein
MQGLKRVVSVLLSLIVLSAGFPDYWSYSQTFYREPGIWMDVVSGTAHAPGQYRVGVIDTAYFLARHTHLGLRHTLAFVDVIAGLIAVFTLFLVLRRSPVYRRASQAAEWFGAASFVVPVQFYLAWLLWYQKPETLPTAAMLSLALLLLTVRLGGRLGTMVPVVGQLLLAMVQDLFAQMLRSRCMWDSAGMPDAGGTGICAAAAAAGGYEPGVRWCWRWESSHG